EVGSRGLCPWIYHFYEFDYYRLTAGYFSWSGADPGRGSGCKRLARGWIRSNVSLRNVRDTADHRGRCTRSGYGKVLYPGVCWVSCSLLLCVLWHVAQLRGIAMVCCSSRSVITYVYARQLPSVFAQACGNFCGCPLSARSR